MDVFNTLVVGDKEYIIDDTTKLLKPDTAGKSGQLLSSTGKNSTVWVDPPVLSDSLPAVTVRNNGHSVLLFDISKSPQCYISMFLIQSGNTRIALPFYSDKGISKISYVTYEGKPQIRIDLGKNIPAWSNAYVYFGQFIADATPSVTTLEQPAQSDYTIYYGVLPGDFISKLGQLNDEHIQSALNARYITTATNIEDKVLKLTGALGTWCVVLVPPTMAAYKQLNGQDTSFTATGQALLASNGGSQVTYQGNTLKVYGEFNTAPVTTYIHIL